MSYGDGDELSRVAARDSVDRLLTLSANCACRSRIAAPQASGHTLPLRAKCSKIPRLLSANLHVISEIPHKHRTHAHLEAIAVDTCCVVAA